MRTRIGLSLWRPKLLSRGDGLLWPGRDMWLCIPHTVVAVAIVAAAWFFGGVRASDQVWLYLLLLVGVAFGILCWWSKPVVSDRIPPAAWPLAIAVALGGLQLVPLPAGVLEAISPQAYQWRMELAATVVAMNDKLTQSNPDRADGALPPRQAALAPDRRAAGAEHRWPLSVYPASTRWQLALLILAILGFVAGVLLFAESAAAMWLCGLLAANGAAVAFFGLVQRLSWNGKLFWQVPLSRGGAPFGPFVNRNNAGGYLLICLGAAIGLAAWAMQRNRIPPQRAYVPENGSPGVGHRAGRFRIARLVQGARSALAELLRSLDGLTIVALALAGCIAGGVLCSLSRGAILSAAGAATAMIVLLLVVRRAGSAAWLVGLALAAAVGLVAWVGMTQAVQSRMATLLDPQVRAQARLPHWQDSVKLIADFAATGSGLGTYRFAYRPYQERLSQSWYYHAENQYLESLAEGGVLGLVLLVAAMVLVARAGLRLVACGSQTRAFALGVAGLFALAGQTIHAGFDFGLYLPANFLSLALLCGAVCGRAERLRKQERSAARDESGGGRSGQTPSNSHSPHPTARPASRPRRKGWAARSVPAVATFLALVAGVWGFGQVRARAAVERALQDARFSRPPQQVEQAAIDKAIDRLDSALASWPDDAEAQHCMATLYLRRYRAEAFAELCNEYPRGGREILWQATSQIVLHGRAHEFARAGRFEQLQALRRHPVVSRSLPQALEHLLAAHQACPLVPEVGLTVAELAWLVGQPSGDVPWLRQVRQLAVSDPDQLFHCGLLALQGDNRELAWSCWKKSLTLSRAHLDDVLQLAEPVAEPDKLAERILPDQPALLAKLAETRYSKPGSGPLRQAVLLRAERLLGGGRLAMQPEERLYWQATVHRLSGRTDQAAAALSRAVQLAPANPQWRYELAMLLQQQGRLADAHREAIVSARLAPENRQYRELLRQINHARLLSAGSVH